MNNRRGQVTTELVLMIVLVVGVAVSVSKFFREQEIFAQIVSGPWGAISGMIQNGVWQSPEKSNPIHPNSFNRFSTVKGEVVQQ